MDAQRGLKRIGIVGSGVMGMGITEFLIMKGFPTILVTRSNGGKAERLKARLASRLKKHEEKGLLEEGSAETTLGLITITNDLLRLKEVELVIEAIKEDLGDKTVLFQRLDGICRPDCIFATNTSSIPISTIGLKTGRPDRTIGMHFMNPAPVMKLVELIRGRETSDSTYLTIKEFVEGIGKTPVTVGDSPGFVANRLLMPFINEAIRCIEEGVAVPEDIDRIAKLGFNHPMGPLELADFIGLDVCLNIMEVIQEEHQEEAYSPPSLIRRMVANGELGRKSGKGFYTYKK